MSVKTTQRLEQVFFEEREQEAKFLFLIHEDISAVELLHFAKDKMHELEYEQKMNEVTFIFRTKPEEKFFAETTFENLTVDGVYKNGVKFKKEQEGDYEVTNRLVSIRVSSLIGEDDFHVYGDYQVLIRGGKSQEECLQYLSMKYNKSLIDIVKQLAFVQGWWNLNFKDREGIDLFKI